ncbi:type IV secretory system conjugative DNA transfer family protein [Pseudobdellovibrio sp. HCB154]|uniref:type IV secretory system conjugative DNA transfer family protein n=1 Tax=Pseudobdellovibrio sp. HCB154 TaxID=3386277 RepID=UPI00391746A1
MITDKSIYIGRTLRGDNPLFLTEKMRCGHVQIIGATGRGKTASVVLPWFIRDLMAGNIPILIDGKGDESILYEMQSKLSVDEFQRIAVFDLSNPNSLSLNPLIGGTPSEIADRLIQSLEFESQYFKDIQHAAVLMVLEVLDVCDEAPTLPRLYELLSDSGKILDLTKKIKYFPEHLLNEVTKFSQTRSDTREERLSGILSQLKPFNTASFKNLVSGNEIDLKAILEQSESTNYRAAVILLNTLQFQKTAKVFGKMVMQLMAWITATRNPKSNFAPVFIDEFSAFVFEGFEQFLNKARSRNIGLHLSHQSLGDLEAVSPSFAKTVNVNTNVKVLLGLNDPDTADYMARHLGTRTKLKSTERAKKDDWGDVEASGEISLRETENYKIHPNKLKNFSRGQGVLSLLVNGYPFTEEVQFDRYK